MPKSSPGLAGRLVRIWPLLRGGAEPDIKTQTFSLGQACLAAKAAAVGSKTGCALGPLGETPDPLLFITKKGRVQGVSPVAKRLHHKVRPG